MMPLVRIKGSHIIVRSIEIKRSLGRGITIGARDNSNRSTNVTLAGLFDPRYPY